MARLDRERMERLARGEYLDGVDSSDESSMQENVKPRRGRPSGSTSKKAANAASKTTTSSKIAATPLSVMKVSDNRPEPDSATKKGSTKKRTATRTKTTAPTPENDDDDDDDDLGITWFGQKAKDVASSSSGDESKSRKRGQSATPATSAARPSTAARQSASAAVMTSATTTAPAAPAASVTAAAGAPAKSAQSAPITVEAMLQTFKLKSLLKVTPYAEAYLRANFETTLAELKKSAPPESITVEKLAEIMGDAWIAVNDTERAVWKLKYENRYEDGKSGVTRGVTTTGKASQRAATAATSYVRTLADEIESIDFSSNSDTPALGLGTIRTRASARVPSASSSTSAEERQSPKRTKLSSIGATPDTTHESRKTRIPPTSPRISIPQGTSTFSAFVSSSPASSSQTPALSSHYFDSSLSGLAAGLPNHISSSLPVSTGNAAVDRASRVLHQVQAEMSMEQLLRQKDRAYEELLKKFIELQREFITLQSQSSARVEEQAAKRTESALMAAQKEIASLRETYRAREEETSRIVSELRQALARATESQLQQLKTPGRSKREMLALEQKENALREMTLQLTTQNRLVAHLQTKLVELQDRENRAREEMKTKQEEWSLLETEYERIIATYRLATCMNVEVNAKNNEYMRCKAVNREQRKLLEFDLLIDVPSGRPGEETVEYVPRKVILNGQEYPSFLRERISFAPSQTPLLLKNILGVVHEQPMEGSYQTQPVQGPGQTAYAQQSQQHPPQQQQQASRFAQPSQRSQSTNPQQSTLNISSHSVAPSVASSSSQAGSQYRTRY